MSVRWSHWVERFEFKARLVCESNRRATTEGTDEQAEAGGGFDSGANPG